MNEELINEVLRRIDEMGATVSEGAAFGYEVLVRQQIISGIMDLLLSLLLTAAIIVTAVWLRRSHNDFVENKLGKKKSDYYSMTHDMDDWAIPRLVPAAIAGIFAIPIAVNALMEGLKHLLNPHYYAIYEILERIPG